MSHRNLFQVIQIIGNFLIVLVLLSGCSSTPPAICTSEGVQKEGYEQAMSGISEDRSHASACASHGQFSEAFERGYAQGKKQYCDAAHATTQGASDGQAGRAIPLSEQRYGICGDRKAELDALYIKYHTKGLEIFCSEAQVRKDGKTQGLRGQSNDFDLPRYQLCGGDKFMTLKAAHVQGYEEGLNLFCEGTDVEADAEKIGSTGAVRENIAPKYSRCSDDQKKKVVALYEQGYLRGLGQLCSPTGIAKEARRRSHEGPSVDYPKALEICLSDFPEAKTIYPAAFSKERKVFVEAHCTYQAGFAEGQENARQINIKRSSTPGFCDSTETMAFMEGYQEGWRQTKERLCDIGKAYDQGMDDAQKSRPMEYSMPSLCPQDFQAKLYRKYQEGYRFVTNQKANR